MSNNDGIKKLQQQTDQFLKSLGPKVYEFVKNSPPLNNPNPK